MKHTNESLPTVPIGIHVAESGFDASKTEAINHLASTVPIEVVVPESETSENTNPADLSVVPAQYPNAIDMRQRDAQLQERYPESRPVYPEGLSRDALARYTHEQQSPQNRIAEIDRNNPYAHHQDRSAEAMKVSRPLPAHLQRRS